MLEFRVYAWKGCHPPEVKFAPEKTASKRVKRLLEIGLKNWSRLNLGLLDRGCLTDGFGIACSVLSKIGDEETVRLVEPFTQDGAKGATAIETIRAIKKRVRPNS